MGDEKYGDGWNIEGRIEKAIREGWILADQSMWKGWKRVGEGTEI